MLRRKGDARLGLDGIQHAVRRGFPGAEQLGLELLVRFQPQSAKPDAELDRLLDSFPASFDDARGTERLVDANLNPKCLRTDARMLGSEQAVSNHGRPVGAGRFDFGS
jgi:hypothetical protein